MEISAEIEEFAERIPDEVRKLRYLRSEIPDDIAYPVLPLRVPRRCFTAVLLAGLAFATLHGDSGLRGSAPRTARATGRSAVPNDRLNDSPVGVSRVDRIWLVERRDWYAVYSNGLQIRADYQTTSAPRRYRSFSRPGLVPSADQRDRPAGIVYHTTESLQVPLEAGRNRSLTRTREGLLNFIRANRLYNFVIDRFGQVFRVVPEEQVAYHAGHSVWASGDSVYEGLNDSFLGIAFEAGTRTSFVPDPAQVRAGRLLTEMLRGQYGIPDANCATHAQVSVNPSNMRIGFHTDWAANFPFREFGFQGGYSTPVASVELFGFDYDRTFLDAIGGRPWKGLVEAEDHVARAAASRGISAEAYRRLLRGQYRVVRSLSRDPDDHHRT